MTDVALVLALAIVIFALILLGFALAVVRTLAHTAITAAHDYAESVRSISHPWAPPVTESSEDETFSSPLEEIGTLSDDDFKKVIFDRGDEN